MRTHDPDIRTRLVAWLGSRPESGRILHEVWIPFSHLRADVVEVNGSLTAFEIKSGADDLSRLREQTASFVKMFDHVTVVCDPRHTGGVLAISPPSCDVIEVAGDRDKFQMVRPAEAKTSPESWLQLRLLWRTELAKAATSAGIDPRRCTRGELRDRLLSVVPAAAISGLVREALRTRNLSDRRFGRRP